VEVTEGSLRRQNGKAAILAMAGVPVMAGAATAAAAKSSTWQTGDVARLWDREVPGRVAR
jgi:hypothetical protein